MNSAFSKIDNRILWLIKILLGLCLAIPILVSSSLIFPYTAPKAFAFRILTEIAAVFYLYLCFKYQELRPKKNIILISLLVFLGILFLSAFFGADFNLSFWGNLERMLGVWGMAHFVLFFLILSAVFREKKDWQRLIKISIIVSSFVALLGIIQRFSSIGLVIPKEERIFSTVGNAAFLAGYLIFNLFLTAYFLTQFFRNRKFNDYRLWLYGVSFFLQLAAFLLSGTRGALLGILAGTAFCLVLFFLFNPDKKIRKYSLAVFIAFFILIASLFVFRSTSLVKGNAVLQRLTMISLQDTTAKNRLILWQKSWLAWQDRPIFGWGQENNEIAINKYFDPRLNPYESWYDRAHNFIFDYGVSGGWLGLLSYLAIIFCALLYLNKTRKEDFYFSAFIVSLLVAYLVQNLFVFDNQVSYLMLFFVLALVNYSCIHVEKEIMVKKNIYFGEKIILAIFAIFILFSIYNFSLKPMQASALASQILSALPEQHDQVEPLLKKVINLKTFASDEIVYQAAIDYLDKINSAPQMAEDESFYKLSSSYLSNEIKNIKSSAMRIKNYIALAWLDLYFSGPDQTRIDKAIDLAEKAKNLSPAKKDSYLILVAAYALKGDNIKAEEIIKQARAIDEPMSEIINQYWQKLK